MFAVGPISIRRDKRDCTVLLASDFKDSPCSGERDHNSYDDDHSDPDLETCHESGSENENVNENEGVNENASDIAHFGLNLT